MEPKFSELTSNWKGVLSSVLAIALLMSGFFWLGYWTAEQNHASDPRSALAVPSPHPNRQPKAPDPEKSEKAEGQENLPANQHLWVNL